MIHALALALLIVAQPSRQPTNDPPPLVKVKPVFFVPRGESPPTDAQMDKLAAHLDWSRRSYRELLKDRDTFTLSEGKPAVHHSGKSLTDLRMSAKNAGPIICSELFASGRLNRFNCPYVFVVVIMGWEQSFPADVAMPFNGGFNSGGGVAVFSSHQLDNLPSFQSALQHSLGHAFGLPHVDAYKDNMQSSDSIMSNNPALRTDGMKPAATPGVFGPPDLRALSYNQRVFPKLALQPVRSVEHGAAELKPLDPIPIDGQPPYAFEVKTDSGETWGTKVSNLARRKRIRINEGGRFDVDSMWESRQSIDGWSSVIVTFPLPMTLVAIGVHSQHSGASNIADGLMVEVPTRAGAETLAESPMSSADAVIPLLQPATSKVWRLSFHAQNNRSVTLRGLRFLTKTGEVFAPPIPYEGSSQR